MGKTRQQKIKFHIDSGDYFASLATVLGLIKDALEGIETATPAERKSLKMLGTLREDLIFVHDRYRIIEKTKV